MIFTHTENRYILNAHAAGISYRRMAWEINQAHGYLRRSPHEIVGQHVKLRRQPQIPAGNCKPEYKPEPQQAKTPLLRAWDHYLKLTPGTPESRASLAMIPTFNIYATGGRQ